MKYFYTILLTILFSASIAVQAGASERDIREIDESMTELGNSWIDGNFNEFRYHLHALEVTPKTYLKVSRNYAGRLINVLAGVFTKALNNEEVGGTYTSEHFKILNYLKSLGYDVNSRRIYLGEDPSYAVDTPSLVLAGRYDDISMALWMLDNGASFYEVYSTGRSIVQYRTVLAGVMSLDLRMRDGHPSPFTRYILDSGYEIHEKNTCSALREHMLVINRMNGYQSTARAFRAELQSQYGADFTKCTRIQLDIGPDLFD